MLSPGPCHLPLMMLKFRIQITGMDKSKLIILELNLVDETGQYLIMRSHQLKISYIRFLLIATEFYIYKEPN